MVYNSVICTKSFNIRVLFYNGHIVLNYTANFVYGPLNSYVHSPWCNITVHGNHLDQVNRFIYLGSMFTSFKQPCDHHISRKSV